MLPFEEIYMFANETHTVLWEVLPFEEIHVFANETNPQWPLIWHDVCRVRNELFYKNMYNF